MNTTSPIIILTLFVLSISSLFAQGSKNALRFDGYDDYVFFDYNNRGITNEVTVEAWVKTTASKLQLITAKYDRNGERGYQLVMRNGRAAFSGRDGSGIYRISGYSPSIINDDNWHHLAGVCKDGTWSIYIDGVLESESVTGYTSVNLSNDAPFTVGNYYMVNNDYYQGEVDEVKIWKKGLSVNEIRDGMCQTADNGNSDLVVYLRFDEGTGSTVIDHSYYGIKGTFRNMSPSTSWVKSGAPIGDVSTHYYPSNWTDQYPNPLQLEDAMGRLFVDGWVGASPKGLQMYLVKANPENENNDTDLAAYYGFFTPLSPVTKAKLRYLPFNSCSVDFQERMQNSSSSWHTLPVSQQDSYFTTTSTNYRGEYKIKGANGTLKIEGNPYTCPNGSTTLTAKTDGSVLWSTGETSKTITVTDAGAYTATTVIAGCTLTETVIVVTASLPTVDLGPDLTICEGQRKTLSAPIGFNYLWSTGATSRTIELSASGTYWVEVTNSQGCSVRDEVNLTVLPMPTIALPAQIFACPNSDVLLDATTPGASYLWSNGQNTPTVLVTAPAELNVAVTVNGCTYIHTVSVLEINTNPSSIQSSGDFCTGSSTILSISTNGSVLWNTGQTSKSISVSQPGEYSVTVTQDGCAYTDHITVREIAYPTVDLGPNLTLCSGEQTMLVAPAGEYTYKWSTGETSHSIEVKSPGTYWIEVTNSNGCTTRDEINVTTNQQPALQIPSKMSACYGDFVTFDVTTPNATYYWSNGQTSSRINTTAPAQLSVDITVDGCTYSFPVTVSSDECPIIPNIITPNGDGKNDSFVLKGINLDAVSIEIFNRWGQSVFKRDTYDNSWAGAGNGMYYYHIKSSQTQKVYKGWVEVIL